MEPWMAALASGALSGFIGAVGAGYWIGRNTPTKADLESTARALYEQLKSIQTSANQEMREIEQSAKDDRHSARSNMEQRTAIFQEKVDSVRDKIDEMKERVHLNENRLTRLEVKINGRDGKEHGK